VGAPGGEEEVHVRDVGAADGGAGGSDEVEVGGVDTSEYAQELLVLWEEMGEEGVVDAAKIVRESVCVGERQ
jgi:hypothetical protein